MNQPTTFGKYLLLERINVGGMAEVFKAKAFGAEGFERLLAIKRILPNMAEDEEFINMFIDEARIAVQLNHANIVPIYELGKYNSQYYIAMEFVSGKDLRQVFDCLRKRQETLLVPAAAYVISKICEGLDYAHRKTDPTGRPLNLIHRDVSPQNVLLSYEGAVKVTDFGIVKAEDRASKTQAGVLKGKFAYMSPEQVRGLDIDHRSDVFAVGILLYEALTGKRLFIGDSDFATLEKVRAAEVTPPREHNPAIPESLEQVVLTALARERDARYQWALELHDSLQQFLIEENSVYNASKLATLLKAEFRDDIAKEMQRMEEFMRMPTPTSQEAMTAAAVMRAAPTSEWGERDHRAEQTMIFESGNDEGAFGATQVAGAGLDLGRLTTGDEAQPLPAPTLLPTTPQPQPRPRGRSTLALALAGLVSLVLLGGLLMLLFAGGKEGTLIVSSTMTDQVDVFIDGELVGQKTPLVRPNVPLGEHTLVAKAPGFVDKAYRFELVAGAPADIKIEMARAAPEAMVPTEGDATIEIISEPPLAAVRLGGVPQASTPTTMTVHDTANPVVLEVVKNGFVSQTVTVSFGPGERKKRVVVKLVPQGGGDRGGQRPGNSARIQVASKPPGATIYLGGAEQGATPQELANLDPHQSYSLEVTREGYHPYEDVVHMNGRTYVSVVANLSPERRRRTAAGGGGGTSTCAGSSGKLSIMPVGIADCRVTVGTTKLGIAPLFKKDSPTGRCPIEVKCPGGKHYQTVRTMRPGVEEKFIIKAEDWH